MLKSKRLDILRKKYDPLYKKYKTHITLVYPFQVEDQEKLVQHIESCIQGIEPFDITLQKCRKSGNYLVLDVARTKELLLKLYKKLNSGILSGFENKELSIYLPHVTLGFFENVSDLMPALNNLRQQNLDFRVDIDHIDLLTLKEDDSVKEIRHFPLKKIIL